MLNNYIFLVLVSAGFLSLPSCTMLSLLSGPKDPRPQQYQTKATENIINTNIPTIYNAQINKQNGIKELVIAGLAGIGSATTSTQIEGISNIIANGIKGIQKANGSVDVVAKLAGKGISDILNISLGEYLAYSAGQTYVASEKREELYEAVKVGFQWTKDVIGGLIGATVGGGGLIAALIMKVRQAGKRRQLLVSTGRVIDDFTNNNPAAGNDLKESLQRVHSELPVNAKKEFNLS